MPWWQCKVPENVAKLLSIQNKLICLTWIKLILRKEICKNSTSIFESFIMHTEADQIIFFLIFQIELNLKNRQKTVIFDDFFFHFWQFNQFGLNLSAQTHQGVLQYGLLDFLTPRSLRAHPYIYMDKNSDGSGCVFIFHTVSRLYNSRLVYFLSHFSLQFIL